jgi:hypothetical protein
MVEAHCSVTAGHGMVTAERPVLGHGLTAGHVAAGRVMAVKSPIIIIIAGPAAQASTARHTGVARSRTLACATEVAVDLCGTCRQARLSRPSLSRRARTGCVAGHVSRTTLRSRLRSKTSQDLKGQLPGSSRHQDRALAAVRRSVIRRSINPPDRLHRSLRPSPTYLPYDIRGIR